MVQVSRWKAEMDRIANLRSTALVRGETGRSKTVRVAAPSRRPDLDWR
jgi:hypothetical protein